MVEGSFGYGFATPEDWSSDFSTIRFVVMRMLARWRTCTLVQVTAVKPGALGPIGTVTVQPLVNMVDGQGTATSYTTIPNIPYLRISGGKNAVICDPAVNDIGVMVVADRDISSVKNSKQTGNPGSSRRADLADGLYLGTILSQGNPNQYVQFTPTGISIVDMNGNSLVSSSTGWQLIGNLKVSGNITAGTSTPGTQVDMLNHTHGGVAMGSSVTTTPTPGS